MTKKTILIFGISSFVGSNLAEILKKDYRVIGTYNKTRVEIEDVLTVPCDVLNRLAVQTVIYTFQPDYTIYAVGLSSISDCSEADKLADLLNSVGVYNVMEYTERYKSKLIYLSTSFVFPGVNTVCMESETPLSNTVFGVKMAATEFYIQKGCLNYLIFRSCPLYGRSFHPLQKTFFELLEYSFFYNQNIPADSRVHTGYLDVQIFAEIIKKSLDANLTNRLVNISTSNIMTRYEFAVQFAKKFKQNDALVTKYNWEYPFDAKNVSAYRTDGDLYFRLNTANLESILNYKMPTIEQSLDFTYSRLVGQTKQAKGIKKSSGVSFI